MSALIAELLVSGLILLSLTLVRATLDDLAELIRGAVLGRLRALIQGPRRRMRSGRAVVIVDRHGRVLARVVVPDDSD